MVIRDIQEPNFNGDIQKELCFGCGSFIDFFDDKIIGVCLTNSDKCAKK
jgi:hypothetical protein